MNKIVILGHKSSGFEKVEEVLYKKGMVKAVKSAVNSLSPQDIVNVLAKSHKTTISTFEKGASLIKTSDIQPIWGGLFADLMIANIDSKIWGWADPNILPFVNYLKDIDHNIFFVLVYRSPKFIFESAIISSDKDFSDLLNDWYLYNKYLLDFYINNKDRAILLNSESISHNFSEDNDKDQLIDYNGNINKSFFLIDNINNDLIKNDENSNKFDLVNEILLNKIIFDKSNIRGLYGSLQEQLGLYVSDEINKTKISDYDLWYAFKKQYDDLKAQKNQIIGLNNKFNISQNELKIKNEEKITIENQFSELKKSFWKVEGLSKWQEKRINELKNEKNKEHDLAKKFQKEIEEIKNKTESKKELSLETAPKNNNEKMEMLKNLLNLQEELEKTYISTNVSFDNVSASGLMGASTRFKKQLPYKLGSTIINDTKSPKKILKLPFSIFKLLIEEDVRKEIEHNLPDLATYDDKHEIEKVKNHLSYKLGSKILEKRKTLTEWIKLPIDLKKQIDEFKKDSNA